MSPCTSNGMAYHWIAQALWHCMTNTQSVENYKQGNPKPTATSGTRIFEAVNRDLSGSLLIGKVCS